MRGARGPVCVCVHRDVCVRRTASESNELVVEGAHAIVLNLQPRHQLLRVVLRALAAPLRRGPVLAAVHSGADAEVQLGAVGLPRKARLALHVLQHRQILLHLVTVGVRRLRRLQLAHGVGQALAGVRGVVGAVERAGGHVAQEGLLFGRAHHSGGRGDDCGHREGVCVRERERGRDSVCV